MHDSTSDLYSLGLRYNVSVWMHLCYESVDILHVWRTHRRKVRIEVIAR